MIQWRKFGLKTSSTFRVMNFFKFMPFSDFYFLFKCIFLRIFFTKIVKKGKSYVQVMTWRVRPAGTLTWHAGPPR